MSVNSKDKSPVGLDKAILPLCAARICRLILAEGVRNEVAENLLIHVADLDTSTAERIFREYDQRIKLIEPELVPYPDEALVSSSRHFIRPEADVPVLPSAVMSHPDWLLWKNGDKGYTVRYRVRDPNGETGWRYIRENLRSVGDKQAKRILAGRLNEVNATNNNLRQLFVVAAVTGMRIGEVLALRWQDVDLDAKKMTVRHNLWRGQLGTPKTKASAKTRNLSDLLVTAFRIQRLNSKFTQPNDFVFARRDGSPYDRDWLRESSLSRSRFGGDRAQAASARISPVPAHLW